MMPRESFQRPGLVLGLGVLASILFGLLASLCFRGGAKSFLWAYAVPITVPVVAFFADRWVRWPSLGPSQLAVDAALLLLSGLRAFLPIPLVSGHALFLIYSLATTQSWVGRFTAALVLIEVAGLKLLVWDDPTLFGGLAVGGLAAIGFRRLATNRPSVRSPELFG